MHLPRFRIRTMMITVAAIAILLGVGLRYPDLGIFVLTIGVVIWVTHGRFEVRIAEGAPSPQRRHQDEIPAPLPCVIVEPDPPLPK